MQNAVISTAAVTSEYINDANRVKITVGCREYNGEIKCYDQTGQEVQITVKK